MHDAARVRGVECVGNLDGARERLVERQRAGGKAIGERLALDQLHHEVIDFLVVADVVQRAEVGMIQRGDRLRLPLEAQRQARIASHACREHLDGDAAVQPRVGGGVDLAHAAGAKGRFDGVRAESRPLRERHCGQDYIGIGARTRRVIAAAGALRWRTAGRCRIRTT
jgi:hypothetical protein